MKKRRRETKQAMGKKKPQGSHHGSSQKGFSATDNAVRGKTGETLLDDIKMSEIILTLAEPLLQKYGNNFERSHSILSLAVISWNLCMLPEATEERIVSEITRSLPQEFSAENVAVMLHAVYMLMERKKELFQDVRRIIVSHEIRKSETGFDLTIGSAPAHQTAEENETDTGCPR